jgi:uncharacterized protein (DUF58 family)
MSSGFPRADADPTLVARSGPLDVVARGVVEGMQSGQHASPYKGTSVEFVEHRSYSQGDELKHIDWRAFAKTGEFYVKQYEEETNLRAYVLVDTSGSMAYGGQSLSKFEYARVLAAAWSYLLLQQRDACGWATFSRTVHHWSEPAATANTFLQLMQCLQETKPGGEGSLADILHSLQPRFRRRSLLALFSDGFDDVEGLLTVLRQWRSAGHEVVFWQILAPEEETFPFRQTTTFRSLENVAEQSPINPGRERDEYLQNYRAFDQRLERGLADIGVDRVKVLTSQPFTDVLGGYLERRRARRR